MITTRKTKFIVINLPETISEKDIYELFIWMGPVESIRLIGFETSYKSSRYAVVKLWSIREPHQFETRIQGVKIRDSYLYVVPCSYQSEKKVFQIIGELSRLLSGDLDDGFAKAAALLTELDRTIPELSRIPHEKLIEILQLSAQCNQLELEHLQVLLTDYFKEKIRKQKRQKKRPARSVKAISTPMGGQPPRKRRVIDPLDEI